MPKSFNVDLEASENSEDSGDEISLVDLDTTQEMVNEKYQICDWFLY